jgi:hypothetical protein
MPQLVDPVVVVAVAVAAAVKKLQEFAGLPCHPILFLYPVTNMGT